MSIKNLNETEISLDVKLKVVDELITQYKKSNERELTVRKELADDEITVKRVEEMIGNGEPLPENSPYDSLDAWLTSIKKEVKTGENSLVKILEQKIMVEALEFYLENISN